MPKKVKRTLTSTLYANVPDRVYEMAVEAAWIRDPDQGRLGALIWEAVEEKARRLIAKKHRAEGLTVP